MMQRELLRKKNNNYGKLSTQKLLKQHELLCRSNISFKSKSSYI